MEEGREEYEFTKEKVGEEIRKYKKIMLGTETVVYVTFYLICNVLCWMLNLNLLFGIHIV